MKLDKKFKIELTYSTTGVVETIEINTDRLEWTMDQYQRNRPAFSWKVID